MDRGRWMKEKEWERKGCELSGVVWYEKMVVHGPTLMSSDSLVVVYGRRTRSTVFRTFKIHFPKVKKRSIST